MTALPDGGYISATYTRGKLAVWGPDGELVRLIGTGEGAGPGEFYYTPVDVAVSDEGVVFVAVETSVEVFTLGGEYVDSYRFRQGVRGIEWDQGIKGPVIQLDQGTLVTVQEDSMVMLVEDAWDERIIGAFPRFAVTSNGYKVSEGPLYSFIEWGRDGRMLDRTTWVKPDWFVESDDLQLARGAHQSQISDFVMFPDSASLAFVAWSPDKPENPVNTDSGRAAKRVWDRRIVVVDPDGEVVASRVFNNPDEAPNLTLGGVWFSQAGDVGLRILELTVIR